MRTRFAALLVALLAASLAARAEDAYVIRNARIVTVSGPVIEVGSVAIEGGVIREVGSSISSPAGAKVIDASGLVVYPGLFDANSTVGMTAARETTLGVMTPHLQVFASFHMDDPDVETARANGVTQVLARPWQRNTGGGRLRPGLLTGQAAVMNLAGWTPGQMAVNRSAGVVLGFPSVGSLEFSDDERYVVPPWSETKGRIDKVLGELKAFFVEARQYLARREGLSAEERARALPDSRLEAMLPVLRGQQPLLIDVDNDVDIRSAVEFARAAKVDFVLMGARQAWRVADFLKENGVRVILTGLYRGPSEDDDPVDILDRTPAILHGKGVSFAISALDSIGSYLLPYQAGTAVAHGLPYDVALRSITLTPAEFLGVADRLGSIDKGKIANLVVADGDILECQTRIKHVFINGRPVSLESRDTRSYEAYRDRH